MEHTNTVLVTVLTIGLFALIIGLASGYNLGLHRIGTPSIGNHMMSNGFIMKDGVMSEITREGGNEAVQKII